MPGLESLPQGKIELAAHIPMLVFVFFVFFVVQSWLFVAFPAPK